MFVAGVVRNTSIDGCWELLDYIRRVVRLDIDVLWKVVRFSVRVIRSICKNCCPYNVELVHDF